MAKTYFLPRKFFTIKIKYLRRLKIMKKLVLRIGTLVMVGTMAVLFFAACKKEYSTCKVAPPDITEQITFDFMNKSLKLENQIYKMNMDKYYREFAVPHHEHEFKEELFQLLKEYCMSHKITVTNQTMSFVLYCDSPISQSLNMNDEHLKGISVYDIEGKRIMHHLFVKNKDSEFYEIENVKVAVPGVAHAHIHFYLENYVFTDNPQNRTYIIVAGDFAVEVEKNLKEYKMPIRYEVKITKGFPESGREDCHNLPKSDKGIKGYVNQDLMCCFRDNFLFHSEKGKIYIDNCYDLMEECIKNVNIRLAVQTALVMKELNPVMRACLDSGEHLSEIMFDNKLSNSILKLLDKYEKITKSTKGKEILNTIRLDINKFRNKPLQEILVEFE